MKSFFIGILAVLLGVAIIRFNYGLQANSSTYIFATLLELPPDVKEEFQIVIEAAEDFSDSLRTLKTLSSTGSNIFDVVRSFFSSLAALLNVPFVFLKFLMNLILHVLRALETLFNLFFGPAVVPIDSVGL